MQSGIRPLDEGEQVRRSGHHEFRRREANRWMSFRGATIVIGLFAPRSDPLFMTAIFRATRLRVSAFSSGWPSCRRNPDDVSRWPTRCAPDGGESHGGHVVAVHPFAIARSASTLVKTSRSPFEGSGSGSFPLLGTSLPGAEPPRGVLQSHCTNSRRDDAK